MPWVGLIAAFVTGCICFLPFPSWQSLVGLITSASVLMYAGAPLSLGCFRRRLPDADPAVPAAGGRVDGAARVHHLRLIILWSGWDTDWKLGIAILIGYVILAVSRVFNLNDKPTAPGLAGRGVAAGLPGGHGLIVYLSNFGPLDDPVFGDWTGIIVAVVFSLVIYYWAMAVALTERGDRGDGARRSCCRRKRAWRCRRTEEPRRGRVVSASSRSAPTRRGPPSPRRS